MPRSKRPRTRDDAIQDGSGASPAGSPGAIAEVHGTPSNGKESASPGSTLVASNDDELWSFKAVVARTGLSRSSIYSYVAQGLFPRQRRLGPRRVGWLASEVRAWIASRPSQLRPTE